MDRINRYSSAEDDGGEPEAFNVSADHACVACACSTCLRCRRAIEVVAIYCHSGTVSQERLEQFTLRRIWAMQPALARQLDRWPTFRFDAQQGCYANHCPHCGVLQEEAELYEEPDQPFFSIDPADKLLRFAPLAGTVQLRADYSVQV